MKATPEQKERFKIMVRDFAERNGLHYATYEYSDRPNHMRVKFAKLGWSKEPNYMVDFGEFRSLSDAGAWIFSSVIVEFRLSFKDSEVVFAPAVTITNVIYNPPATIVFWSDGSKTVVKCGENDEFDPEKGLAMAISKKMLGNQGNYYNEFKKWTGKYDAATEKVESECPHVLIPESVMANVRNNIRNYLRSIVGGALG